MRDPIRFQLLLATFAAWVNREQTNVIDYLREENRVLKEQLGKRCCASCLRQATA